ncbi:50S ribosomal protein L5 [Mycoplasma iguanae]|uniref:Large ribosomal subunit protein uL5 n=1 Tax=Mycoplasma iguanae TaxID=292461 RepID=A0ABY5RAI5_9MOLU|nr:50S ribosomal protein L5 [Mycoplasma iguanae]UVD81789.1 50S ribosomal protein L5 [Mycoplasma iguanae]
MNSLKSKYEIEVKQALTNEFKYSSVMELPKIEKIVINMTVGKEVNNDKAVEEVVNELKVITGQKPFITKAKKSLASWKLREGMDMGGKVTLRKEKMWDFLNKLINVAIPRIRDFRGVNPKAFDGKGNYSLGVKEQIIFPEIKFENIRRIKGLDVIIVTTAKTDAEAKFLLEKLGMPFAKVEK